MRIKNKVYAFLLHSEKVTVGSLAIRINSSCRAVEKRLEILKLQGFVCVNKLNNKYYWSINK